MNFMRFFFILALSLTFILPAHAIEPADNTIKNALTDIIRFEQQSQGLTSSRASNVNRILKLMNLSYERLQGSPNQTDPSWQEVNQRYVNLKAQLEQLLAPAANAAPTPTQPSAPTTKATAPTTTSGHVPELVSGQRVRLKKLLRDITNVHESLVTTGPSPFQAASEVEARQKRLRQFEAALKRYPQVTDSDVKAARQAYEKYRQALSAEFQRSRQQLQELGDAQQRLATLEANTQQYPVPALLVIPFSQEQATAWVAAASKARTVAEHNIKELQKIAPLAYLPETRGTPQTGAAYDASDVDRLQRGANGRLQQIEAVYQQMATDLKSRLTHIENEVLKRFGADPKGERSWIYLQKKSQSDADQLYTQAIAEANSAVYLEEALSRDSSAAKAVIAKIEQAQKDFTKNRTIALNSSRLPTSKSKNKELLSIAKKIVENPKYEFGQYGPIVLTTDKVVERERKDSEVDIDDAEITIGGDLKMSGTETTWTYKWKEFKFAVPLKETDSEEWYVWWITAKKFSSGGARTPIDTWVSGQATKGNLILKKNF